MNLLDAFFFGIYPYIALSIFFVGLYLRFKNNAYSVSTRSSLIISDSYLRIGNIFFHIGILGLLIGHVAGLLTPIAVVEAFGITHSAKQIIAMISGSIFGSATLIGLSILLARRIFCEKIRATSTISDYIVLIWLLVTLLTGLSTIFLSFSHLDGEQMVLFMTWANHIITFKFDAYTYLENVAIGFKIHMILGFGVFIIFPFTRLAHAISGFLVVLFLGRSTQITRTIKG